MCPLMPVRHIQQRGIGYCLPACAAMAAGQFGLDISQSRLARNFGTMSGIGTPFSAIRRLIDFDLAVEVVEWLGIDFLRQALLSEKAVVAAVLTSRDLPTWGTLRTQHTLLVTAMEKGRVYYHDPALSWGPVEVSVDAFGLAWSEMSELTALIRRA